MPMLINTHQSTCVGLSHLIPGGNYANLNLQDLMSPFLRRKKTREKLFKKMHKGSLIGGLIYFLDRICFQQPTSRKAGIMAFFEIVSGGKGARGTNQFRSKKLAPIASKQSKN